MRGVSLARTNGKVKIREHPFLLLITAGVAAAIAVHDLGSAALVLGTLVMLLFAAGADWRWLPAGIITLGLFGGLYIGMEEYRIRRLDAWLAPWEQTNTNEAPNSRKVSGRFTKEDWKAAGMGQGLRSQGYLAVDESDFVFAILAEETGVLGTALVLTTFAGLIFSSGVSLGNVPILPPVGSEWPSQSPLRCKRPSTSGSPPDCCPPRGSPSPSFPGLERGGSSWPAPSWWL